MDVAATSPADGRALIGGVAAIGSNRRRIAADCLVASVTSEKGFRRYSMNIHYRPAQVTDISAIAALLAALFAIEQDFNANPVRQITALTLMLERDDILLQIAESGGEVVGFCSVQSLISTAEGGSVGLVEDVVVAPAWRGQGVGRGLLEAAEAWSKQRGYTRLQLLADEDNAPALEFYRRQGWRRTNMHNWRRGLA